MQPTEQAGAFRFVLAAVNDPRCTATFDDRWLVLRKLWRVAGELPPHLQGGAKAALKQTLFDRRLNAMPQQAAKLHFETWDDVPHGELQDATYPLPLRSWRREFSDLF